MPYAEQCAIAVQWIEGTELRCRGYAGIAVDRPAFIVIAAAQSRAASATARLLVDELELKLLDLAQNVQRIWDMSHDQQSPTECGAFNTQAQRLLVVVGDDQTLLTSPPFLAHWSRYIDVAVLPVLPESARLQTSQLLDSTLSHENAVFWSANVNEVIPPILACSAATLEVPRIFISYRRPESDGLAKQLFDALSHRGFDVFLDHYRIPPGVNFQQRLTHELGDKTMVLVIESETIESSEWTKYEISTAQSCELTLFGLLVPKGEPLDAIGDAWRHEVADTDFVGGSFHNDAKLTDGKIAEVVAHVRNAHDRGVIARRGATREQVRHTLLLRGVVNQQLDSNGAIVVTGGPTHSQKYVIWTSPRSPELADFHVTHGAAVDPVRGVVVSLSRLMEWRSRERVNWLAGVCKISSFDKGEIDVMAQQIASGSL